MQERKQGKASIHAGHRARLRERFLQEGIGSFSEHEVLELLLSTEDGVQEIADSLYLSRRTLHRYISSIYEKTETKSRIGLFKSFTGFWEEYR